MPIYEFICESCRHEFETLVTCVGGEAPCPKCGGEKVTKAISRPAAPQTQSSTPSGPPPCASSGG